MATERTVKLIAKLQDNMSGGLQSLARGGVALAGAITGVSIAVLAAAKKMADYGAAIYDVATANNLALDTTQALGYVADQTGSSLGGLAGSVRALNTFMTTAATAGSVQAQALETLGLRYDDLQQMAPEDVFLSITDALGGVEDELTQNMTAAAVFGNRFGTQVVGALNQAGGSLRTMMDSFNESGRAMSGEQLEALKKYSDAMTDLDYAFKKMTVDALMPMLPALQDAQANLATLASDTLPKLMPLIETVIDIMIDNLPRAIQLLGYAVDGWSKISDSLNNAAGNSADTQILLDSLTAAVQTGAYTAEQAAAEWDKYTRIQRTAGEVAWGVINPVQGLVDVAGDLNSTMGVVGEQQVIVSRELDNTARAAFQAAAGIGAVANVAAGSAGPLQGLGGMYAGIGAALAEINAEMGQGVGGDEVPIVGLGTETGRKDAVNSLKEDLKALIEEAARLEDERYAENKARAVSAHETEMGLLLAEHAAAKAQQTDRMATEQARVQMIRQGTASLFTGLAMAATQGQDALDAWFNSFKQRLLELTISSAFQALLGVLTPGGFLGGIFGGLFGRAGGGIVPGSVPGAAGGMIVPGGNGRQGDQVPMMLTPGEVVLTRAQVNDLSRSSGGGVSITVDYRPILSTASSAEIGRLGVEVKKALQKVGAL